MMQQRIAVHVRASDPLSYAGVVHSLRQRPEVRLVQEEDLDGEDAGGGGPTSNVAGGDAPLVGLVATERMDDEAAQLLRQVRRQGCSRVVLVAGRLDDDDLLGAVETGVCGVVRRSEATADRLVHVLQTAAAGDGSLPPDLLGRLLRQVARLQQHVLAPHGLNRTGLSDRETRVLRLVADGKDTHEIATELAYSERTVKNVLHDVTSRLQLRNRSHAVAYALREGLI